jgi:Glycine zipper 2TM domain
MSRFNACAPAALLAASVLIIGGCAKSADPQQSAATPPPASADAAPASAAPAADLATRQQELAQREADLAMKQRELEVARRELELARKEKSAAAQRVASKPASSGKDRDAALPAASMVVEKKPVLVAVTVPSGTQLTVALSSALSTKTAMEGDPFEARLAADLNINGKRAVPANSRVLGTVTDVISGSSHIGGVPTLGLRFDSLLLDDGQKIAINGELVEQGKSDTGRDTAKILGGAAAGAILGHQVKSNDGGKIIGGLLGGAIGAVAARQTGTEVQLPAGSTLTISLGAPFDVVPR